MTAQYRAPSHASSPTIISGQTTPSASDLMRETLYTAHVADAHAVEVHDYTPNTTFCSIAKTLYPSALNTFADIT